MLVWACIAPHGGELIPELANPQADHMAATRAAMCEMGKRAADHAPEAYIVFTPHGITVRAHACISVTNRLAGSVTGENGATVHAEFAVDRALAEQVAGLGAYARIPIVEAAYRSDGRPAHTLDLDWGALVPLWFMGAQWRPAPSVVSICPARELSRRQLIELGAITAQAAELSDKRVAIICSADQAHGHGHDGPYGHSPTSRSYDRAYCRAIRDNALHRLLRWSDKWIESALPDSYWQTLMLYGVQREVGLTPELLCYEAPTYFGMACATFTRV